MLPIFTLYSHIHFQRKSRGESTFSPIQYTNAAQKQGWMLNLIIWTHSGQIWEWVNSSNANSIFPVPNSFTSLFFPKIPILTFPNLYLDGRCESKNTSSWTNQFVATWRWSAWKYSVFFHYFFRNNGAKDFFSKLNWKRRVGEFFLK